jgi:hypothetical protein
MSQPIHEQTRKTFLNFNLNSLLQTWLDRLYRRNQTYQDLYPHSEEAYNLLMRNGCFLGVPFQTGAIAHLYTKMIRLQDYLQRYPTLTHFGLLERLEPRLAGRYRQAFLAPSSVKRRFELIDGDFYKKTKANYITCTLSGTILESQNIPFKKSTLTLLQNQEHLGPKQALDVLRCLVPSCDGLD